MFGSDIWSSALEAATRGLKDEKISISILIVLALIVVYSYTWAQDEFVSEDKFEQHTHNVQKSLDNLAKTINAHVEEYRIVEASRVIRDLKRDIVLEEAKEQLHPDAPAINPLDLRQLKEQLKHAEEYKRCLISRQPNCQHLRWPE